MRVGLSILVMLATIYSCKSKEKKELSDEPKKSLPAADLEASKVKEVSAEEKDAASELDTKRNEVISKGKELLAKEDLDAESEFKKLSEAISEYQNSDEYKNPKDDIGRQFNASVDLAALLKKEDYVKLTETGDCSRFESRINNELGDIESYAEQVVDHVNEKITAEKETLDAAKEEEGEDEGEEEEEEKPAKELVSKASSSTKPKGKILQGTGIALTIFGALGLTGSVLGGPNIKAKLGNAIIPAYFLVVGLLVVSNDNPSSAVRKMIRYPLYALGGISILGGLAAMAAGGKVLNIHLDPNEKKLYYDVNTKQILGEDEYDARNRGHAKGVGVEIGGQFMEARRAAKKFFGGGLVMSAIGASMITLGALGLQLADAKQSAKDILLGKMSRALVACVLLNEAKGG